MPIEVRVLTDILLGLLILSVALWWASRAE